ncbi:hypothetical protein HMPREF1984_00073 [Leptotrichia sp. oral taxon 215 str. W9775]|nr:hypothetical protein HMPREF1984_00073 [Leptotrichia sp. oral taxon 215 str. W9775]
MCLNSGHRLKQMSFLKVLVYKNNTENHNTKNWKEEICLLLIS